MKQPAVADPAKVTTWRLPNGLRVAVLRDPRARLYSVDLRFDVGASDDPAMRAGAALVTGEAIVAAGLRDRPAGDPRGHAGSAPDVELTTQLAIDQDRTEITTTALDLPGALELAARRLETTCADFTPELLAAAREHALQQLTGVPPSLVQAVWGDGHPYAHELGTPQLAAIPPAELCGFYTALYGANAATLVVTGPVDTTVPGMIDTRFHDLVAGAAKRAAIPVITPTTQRLRKVVWGLSRPTAALAFDVPAEGDLDDIVPELAMRRIQLWAQQAKRDVHAVLVGGRRGRALVIGIEVEREADLPVAHERLRDLLSEANIVIDEDSPDGQADDQLREAEDLDDPFVRGARIADLIASGRRVELLRRARAFATAKSPRSWIREHLFAGVARTLDLVPAVANGGVSIEELGAPAVAVDHALAGVYRTSPADSATADDPAAAPVPALARPAETYTLANGLRVVLAPDPQASTVDVRLLFPVGTTADPAPGLALRAAADLLVSDDVGPDDDARKRIVWYGEKAIARNDVDVTTTTTHFRAFGFATLADWHVFSIAWHVIAGKYELVPLEPFKRHYAPKGATLIVTGGFDLAVLKPVIERWFGPWKTPSAPPPRAVPAGPKRPLVFEPGELQTVDVELAYGPAKISRGAAMLLASAIQERLARVTRTTAAIVVQLDPRDLRLLLTAQIDPADAPATAHAIAGELAQLRATGAAAAEVASARRRAVAHVLASEIGVAGRGRALEAAIANAKPPNDDTALDELRTATADDLGEAARLLIDPASLQVTLRSPKQVTADVLRALGLDPASAERR
ncbi:MAG TPA: insulinase family protein [Kofleriaceae bacterium]|nr:insulinase family protein [Kofleriaceae bacterium]